MPDRKPDAPPGGVLIVTRADLFPANYGAAVKIDQTALALSRLGCPVRIVTEDRRHFHLYLNGRRTSQVFPVWLRIGPWSRLIRHRLRFRGIPVDEAFMYVPLLDWSITLRAAYLAARTGARVFQAEFPGHTLPCVRLRRIFGGCALLSEHNVEFERVGAQWPTLTPQVRKFLRKTEVELCNRADQVVTVSALDREALVAAGVDAARTRVIPLGVDIASFEHSTPANGLLRKHGIAEDRTLLVYHGTFRYQPNLEAIRILAHEILPRLQARGYRPVVLAVGAQPPLEALHPDVIFTGAVDKVAPYLKAAAVAVVPLKKGGGTRMKVLDYFAASVPVVSTSKGVEGMGLTDGEQALIRDSYDDIAEAVAVLLSNPELSRRLTESGRRFVQQFDWSNIAAAHLRLYAECLPFTGAAAES